MVLFWSLLQISTWSVGHRFAVSSLAWNNSHILTTGALDGKIVNNDVRVRTHIVSTYSGHTQVCGLKWSLDGQQLASGGGDNIVTYGIGLLLLQIHGPRVGFTSLRNTQLLSRRWLGVRFSVIY